MPFPRLTERSVTIASGQASSAVVDTKQEPLVGVRMPATWTDAHLVVEDSPDGISFQSIYSRDYDQLRVRCPAGGSYPGAHTVYFSPIEIACSRYVRVRSTNSASNADLNQGALRTLTLITKDA